jgi:3-dehydroquinate synthase
MLQIDVDLGPRSYTVSIGHGLLSRIPELSPVSRRPHVIVSDSRVWALHGRRVERALGFLGPHQLVLVPPGERSKSRAALARLHDAFLEAELRRDGLVVAVGGGVVGDLAGFAAATFMRGVDWLLLPTTLLAMVDSSVGGKVGINHPLGKNLIGAFHQPAGVIADPELLETLPARQRRSGAYEILKCGLIADVDLFEGMATAPPGLAGWDRPAVDGAIAAAVRVKARVVERDEREGGLRRVLNLGHTVGHALEAVTRYRRFTHGEAVGSGMIVAAAIARGRGLLGAASYERLVAAVERGGPRPSAADLDVSELMAAVGRDKKALAGHVHFVLPRGLGRVLVAGDVTRAEVRRGIRELVRRERRSSRR